MQTMPFKPCVSLSTFAEFVVAPASRKIAAVQGAVALYERDYHPGRDFYKPWRDSAAQGLELGDDARFLGRAVAEARPVQLPHFQALTTGWMGVRSTASLTSASQPSRTWSGPGLDIRISLQVVWADGRIARHVTCYLKQEPLTKDAANAALHILAKSQAGDYAVLDVRRGRFFKPVRTARGFDAWLNAEAQGFANMWQQLRQTA